MPANPVPGLVIPGIDDPTQGVRNFHAVLTWAKSVSPRMYTVSSAWPYGASAPPAPPSDAYLEQVGQAELNFATGPLGAGSATLTYPLAWVNGTISVQVTSTDSSAVVGYTAGTAGANSVILWAMLTDGSGPYSTGLFVDYRVLGW